MGCDREFSTGTTFPLRITLGVSVYKIHISLEAEAFHFDTASGQLDCRFSSLDAYQTALFNRVLRIVADDKDIQKTALEGIKTKDNFIRVIKQEHPPEAMTPLRTPPKKQVAGIALATAIGLGALALILYNLYLGAFTIRANDAMVVAQTLQLRAYSSGIFASDLPPSTLTVTSGQKIGTILLFSMNPNEDMAAQAMEILSPCDCIVMNATASNGNTVFSGENIMTLVPSNARPWILAEIEADKAIRLADKTPVEVRIAGSNIPYQGFIQSTRSDMQDNSPVLPGMQRKPAQVKIALQQKIPVDFIGRPARAVFKTR